MNNQNQISKENVGKKIKLARMKANLTQEELAEKLSLSTRYISQLERGISFGSINTITNICQALNINSDFLLSDLVTKDVSDINDLIDEKFLKNYLKLNSYNKAVLNSIVSDLVKIQESNLDKFKKA